MAQRAFILLVMIATSVGSTASATTIGRPVHCMPPVDAVKRCVSAKAVLRLVVGPDGKLVSSAVSTVQPSPLFDKWAQCLATNIDSKILPGTVKRLGPGTHLFPIQFDPGECSGTRSNNSFKPNPLRGSA